MEEKDEEKRDEVMKDEEQAYIHLPLDEEDKDGFTKNEKRPDNPTSSRNKNGSEKKTPNASFAKHQATDVSIARFVVCQSYRLLLIPKMKDMKN